MESLHPNLLVTTNKVLIGETDAELYTALVSPFSGSPIEAVVPFPKFQSHFVIVVSDVLPAGLNTTVAGKQMEGLLTV